MTITGYIALAVTLFGALTFSVLALHYWRRDSARRDPVFAALTLVCGAAFVLNVLNRTVPGREVGLGAALDLTTSLVPPLLFHLVSRGRIRWLTIALYGFAAATGVALVLDDLSLVSVPFRDPAPAILLAGAALLGLALVDCADRRLRRWYRLILSLTAGASIAGLASPSAITMLAPDFLVLAFFCVTLYYRERLIFFDLLIKQGMRFCFAVGSLVLALSLIQPADKLTIVLVLTPLLLVIPWVYHWLGRFGGHVFLRRRCTPEQAERLVQSEMQLALHEDDLRVRAQRSLSNVFDCVARVEFTWPLPRLSSDALASDALVAVMPDRGQLVLEPRPSGIPFMTDDRRLLDSLALTLGMVLDNVRFREREQQLRLLASRAELKALRAQINPHFLFNSLNAIAGFIPSRPDLADDAIEQLAQVFRYTLRKSEKEWARLDEEAEFAAAYLRLEKARFGERLEVSFEVDPDVGTLQVPAMCVQPLIENAIRHGTSTLEGKGVVGLRIVVNGATASIEVSDNGPGFPAGFTLVGSPGHGLRNVAERLKGYYGSAAQLNWGRDEGSSTTRVVLRVPIA